MPSHTPAKRRKTAKKVARKIKKLKAEGKSTKRAVAQAINTVKKHKKSK